MKTLRTLSYILTVIALALAGVYVCTWLEPIKIATVVTVLAEMYTCTAWFSTEMATLPQSRIGRALGLVLAAGLGVVAGLVVGTALLTICLGIASPLVPWAIGLTFLVAGTVPGLLAARRQRS